MDSSIFIPLSFADALNVWIQALVVNYGDFFHEVSGWLLRGLLVPIEKGLLATPPILILALVAIFTWFGVRRISSTILFTLAMYFIGSLGLWEKTMQTLAIMLVSILLAVVMGIPAGIVMARSRWLSRLFTPVLDVMQTFPMFVYMLPAVMLFSIGKVPAVIATVIYALPPLVRLTELGIRQVDTEVREAATSFGASQWQLLKWVQMPLARASLMAGINQTTMMALAMVVVASMIGARGLGEDILHGLTNLDFGVGAHAGFAVVILAIVIDRITQAYGLTSRQRAQLRRRPLPKE